MEDEIIVELLWGREEQGLIELKDKYGKQLICLAKSMLNAEDAEECVSDTYIAVWNSIPPKRPKFLFAYVAKICRNLSLDKVKWNHAEKRCANVITLSQELEQCVADVNCSEEMLGHLLSEFLRSLSDEKRRIFIRRYWYGDSIRELAKEYGYREGKIKSILFRVRNELREYLKKEGIAL